MRIMYGVVGAWILGVLICGAQNSATAPCTGTELSNSVSVLEKTVQDQDKETSQRLDKLEKRVNQLVDRMGGNGATLSLVTIDRKVSDLDKRVTKLERDMDQLKNRVNRLESRH